MSGEPSANNTRALVESALLSVLVIILYMMDFGTGLLSWLAPIPVSIICLRHGIGKALMMTIASSLGVGIILGLHNGIFVLTIMAFIGIPVGICLMKNYSNIKSIPVVALGILISMALSLLTYTVVAGIPILSLGNELISIIDMSIDGAIQIYESAGLSADEINVLSQTLVQFKELFLLRFPSMLSLAFCSIAGAYVICTKFIAKKIGFKYSDTEPLYKWRLPWTFIWGLILGMFLSVFGNIAKQSILTYIGSNIVFIFGFVYALQGISIVYFIFNEYKVSNITKVFFIVSIFLFGSIQVMLSILGLSDIWLDWRTKLSGGIDKKE